MEHKPHLEKVMKGLRARLAGNPSRKISNLLTKMPRSKRMSKLSETKLRAGQSREPMHGYLSL